MALMHRPTLGILVAASAAVVFNGCTTKAVDTSNSTQSTGNTSEATSAGVGGYGGSGGYGATTGVGGEGATATTGSGGFTCVGDAGYQTAQSCDEMTIAPSPIGPSAAICGESGMDNPPGYDLCLRAAEIFTGGSFDYLQACLSNIGTNPEACDFGPVGTCVGDMFDAACDLPITADNCAAVAQQCAEVGDYTFDEAKCAADLRPFSAGGWTEMVDCFNASTDPGDCQTVWVSCYENEVFVF
jgi:hypothetical protein